MQRKVFIHYNEPTVDDNEIVVVTFYGTSDYRTVDSYNYRTLNPALFGMFSTYDPVWEVATTWFASDDDELFSADARAKDKDVAARAKDMMIA